MRAAYAELQVTDLAASEHFYVDLLGLSSPRAPTTRSTCAAGRSARTTRSSCAGPPPPPRRGWRSASAARSDLDPLADDFDAPRLVTRLVDAGPDPGMGRALRVWDPFGYPLEFFHEMSSSRPSSSASTCSAARRSCASTTSTSTRPAARTRSGSGSSSASAAREYISTDGEDERITGAWLPRKPTVHDVALTAGTGPRLHHFGL